MRIELGAHVWTHDGQVAGKVRQLIVDPSQQTLDAFVVHTQWIGQDLIVPIGDVEQVDADDAVHLTITDEQFRGLPQFVVSEYVVGGETTNQGVIYGYGGSFQDLTTPMPTAGGSHGLPLDYAKGPLVGASDVGSSVVMTQSSLSDNEFAVTKGTRVMSSDDHHIGSVHELSATDEGKLNGLVVASGHIRKHLQYVPMTAVGDADSDAVYLHMTAEEFKDLERTEPSGNELP